jgi:hypothetical protein
VCRQVVQHDVRVEFVWREHVDPCGERQHVPLRSWSCVIVRGPPGFNGSDGWVQFNAWHWVVSSKENTTARWGGSRDSPTSSTGLASTSASCDGLNLSTCQDREFRALQIRCTVSLLTPCFAASVGDCLGFVMRAQCHISVIGRWSGHE